MRRSFRRRAAAPSPLSILPTSLFAFVAAAALFAFALADNGSAGAGVACEIAPDGSEVCVPERRVEVGEGTRKIKLSGEFASRQKVILTVEKPKEEERRKPAETADYADPKKEEDREATTTEEEENPPHPPPEELILVGEVLDDPSRVASMKEAEGEAEAAEEEKKDRERDGAPPPESDAELMAEIRASAEEADLVGAASASAGGKAEKKKKDEKKKQEEEEEEEAAGGSGGVGGGGEDEVEDAFWGQFEGTKRGDDAGPSDAASPEADSRPEHELPYEEGGLLVSNLATGRSVILFKQQNDGNHDEQWGTKEAQEEAVKYLRGVVLAEEGYAKVYRKCNNRHALCSFWAYMGECYINKEYMIRDKMCLLACRKCDQLPGYEGASST